jgi:hypothetical protein
MKNLESLRLSLRRMRLSPTPNEIYVDIRLRLLRKRSNDM